MKQVLFKKYKEHLNKQGYLIEREEIISKSVLWTHKVSIFSKRGEQDKYRVNIFYSYDNVQDAKVSAIFYGHGTIYSGTWKEIKMDMRYNMWKEMTKWWNERK